MNWRAFWIGWFLMTAFWLGIILADKAKADTGCKANPLYCKIIQFDPTINRATANLISNIVAAKSKEYRINPNVALAILMQESGLRNMNTFKTTTSVSEFCSQFGCAKITTTTERAFDMSIAQINVETAIHYGFDLDRLYKLDMDYALNCYFIVLRDKINTCPQLGDKAWSCYHSTTDAYRIMYQELVSRYL